MAKVLQTDLAGPLCRRWLFWWKSPSIRYCSHRPSPWFGPSRCPCRVEEWPRRAPCPASSHRSLTAPFFLDQVFHIENVGFIIKKIQCPPANGAVAATRNHSQLLVVLVFLEARPRSALGQVEHVVLVQVVLETLEHDAALLTAALRVHERDYVLEIGLNVAELRIELGMLDRIGRVALEQATDRRIGLHGLRLPFTEPSFSERKLPLRFNCTPSAEFRLNEHRTYLLNTTPRHSVNETIPRKLDGCDSTQKQRV